MNIIIFILTALIISNTFVAKAVCPVCSVAVGVGVGLSRWLGIDDTISGFWIGALIVSMGLWLANWIRSKNFKIKNIRWLELWSVLFMAVFTLYPLHYTKMLSDPYNIIFGFNKILFGSVIGSLLFVKAVIVDKMLRKTNNGKVYVPYQKVILPVSFLLIASFVMYFLVLPRI